jgi:putative effector of murein hydrolase LrgA (UPF0299 family)
VDSVKKSGYVVLRRRNLFVVPLRAAIMASHNVTRAEVQAASTGLIIRVIIIIMSRGVTIDGVWIGNRIY